VVSNRGAIWRAPPFGLWLTDVTARRASRVKGVRRTSRYQQTRRHYVVLALRLSRRRAAELGRYVAKGFRMALTSLDAPLMHEILQIIHAHGQIRTYDTDWITARVRQSGYWDSRNTPQSPERTINSYFSQSPDVFENVGRNQYRLRLEHLRAPPRIQQIDDAEPSEPRRTLQTVSRIIRQTKLIEQLKLLHDNRCQICGLAIQLGDTSYSEGHHIRPLARNGPDVAENILILCPNHHVLCDYGGPRLDRSALRLDSRHNVGDQYIEWHNAHFFGA
jgi:hypothetical protein